MSRGLCMYQSLIRVCPDFHLFVFAFDDIVFSLLSRLELSKTSIISLKEFEDDELLSVKPTRNRGEYCWTATSSTILYCLQNFEIDHCIYLDADLIFYSDPNQLLKEMNGNDVLITDHFYTPEYDISKEYGKYCVQFIYFKNSSNGIKILEWWREACLNWCYARIEDGKFGDQKYLDNWPDLFQGVYENKHIGGGVAPWNVQQYKIVEQRDELIGIEKRSNISFKIVFFHFHHLSISEVKFIKTYNLGPYKLDKDVIRLIYKPYIMNLIEKEKYLKSIKSDIESNVSNKLNLAFIKFIYYIFITLFNKNKILYFR